MASLSTFVKQLRFRVSRSPMKFFRYRRPSFKTMLGVTKANKRLKREIGITALMKPVRWLPNQKRRLKRKIGYESNAGRLLLGGLPKPGGCLLTMTAVGIGGAAAIYAML